MPNQPTQQTPDAKTTMSTARRANPNQNHFGIKAFIISTSIAGTLAGWGVLVNNELSKNELVSTQTMKTDAEASVASDAVSTQSSNTLNRIAADTLASNEVKPRVRESQVQSSQTKPSASLNAGSRARPTESTALQPKIREVEILPSPAASATTPARPKAVVRSRSSR